MPTHRMSGLAGQQVHRLIERGSSRLRLMESAGLETSESGSKLIPLSEHLIDGNLTSWVHKN